MITDDDESIFIAERNAMHAMDGDRVRVLVYAKRRGHDAEGEVVEIVEKTPQIFVGTLEVQKHFAFLLTDNKVLANDIFIPKTALKGGKTGDKAVVRITEWPDRARAIRMERSWIYWDLPEKTIPKYMPYWRNSDCPYRYPEAVEKAANKIPDAIIRREIACTGRFQAGNDIYHRPEGCQRFRRCPFYPPIIERKLGGWRAYSRRELLCKTRQYHRQGGRKPGNLGLSGGSCRADVARLLCNEICSLRPDEDKLTFSCVFELNGNAEVQKSHIARTVIRSNRRFAYEEAQEVIETGEGDYKEEILALNDLAQKLRKRRFDNGSINFDRHEVKFDIDESGKPIGVYFKVSKEANKLIEEFMLLANRTVAEFIGKPKDGKKPKAFVYRVHDLPDPDKMASFAAFITRFGYKIKTEGSKADLSKGINSLLANVQGKPEENLVETIAIRAMAKAVYTTVNIGHYGLSFDYYYPLYFSHTSLSRLDGASIIGALYGGWT